MPPKKSKKGAPKKKGKRLRLEIPEKTETVIRICEEYARGENTIDSICKAYGVPYSTFYGWVTEGEPGYIEGIENHYKKAKSKSDQIYMDRLSRKAKTALEKRVEGYETEEKVQETDIIERDGRVIQVPKKLKLTKKTVGPDTTAIIFALKNTDPEKFKDRYDHDVRAEGLVDYFDSLRDKGRLLAKKETKLKAKKK